MLNFNNLGIIGPATTFAKYSKMYNQDCLCNILGLIDTFRAGLHIEVKKKIQISKIVVQFLITQFEELFARV